MKENRRDRDLEVSTYRYTEWLVKSNYVKNFTWAGIPIMQYPSDLMVMQELIYKIKPNCLIETGIAFGGMTKFYADMMALVNGEGGGEYILSVDIDIRPHARKVIKDCWVHAFEGSSINPEIYTKICKKRREAWNWNNDLVTLVSLDSHHTASHVLQELRLYAPLVSLGSYLIVFDTAIEFFSHLDRNQNRPWHKGNNPWTAVQEFMKGNDEFIVDKDIEQRALLTAAPGGWLRRVK